MQHEKEKNMNKLFYKLCLVLLVVVSLVSCAKSDSPNTVPLRDYNVQYLADLDTIDKYIDTHYITVDADYNVTFNDLPTDGSQLSIRAQTQYPLQFKMYQDEIQDVNYKIYYISLREGIDKRPSSTDSIHVSYKGVLATSANSQFDYSENPVWFKLDEVVSGWSKIFPMFKTGIVDPSEGPNPVTSDGYGAGIMFLPSGLGYYANSSPSGTIPAYSPLVFSFKLVSLQYRDQDRDGVLSKDEVPSGSVVTYNPLDYDSDGDGTANLYDINDDGDQILTKNEIHKDSAGLIIFEDCDGDGIPNYLDPDACP